MNQVPDSTGRSASVAPASVQQYLDLDDRIRKLRLDAEALEQELHRAGGDLAGDFPDVVDAINAAWPAEADRRRQLYRTIEERIVQVEGGPALISFSFDFGPSYLVRASARRVKQSCADKVAAGEERPA